jgi:hypothetical protein
MNAYRQIMFGLAAVLAWGGGGLMTAAHAQDEGLILVHHRLTAMHQAGPMETGQLVVEVTNLGATPVEDLYLNLEPTPGAPSAPPDIQIGSLGPSELKVVQLPYHRPAQAGNESMSRLTWRIGYVNEQGVDWQAVVHSASPISGLENGGRQ